jgi:hypothetical protein
VNVVTVHGHFVDFLASTPPGEPSPTGTEMTFTVDRETGFVLMEHIGGHKLATATAARVKAKASSRRPRAKAASWGSGCTQAEGHHCYAATEWYMRVTGGAVEGSIDNVDTTAMYVPGWAEGDFVNQEGWTEFPGTVAPNGLEYWVESGQTSGRYMDCCTVRPFWARNNAQGYTQGVSSANWCCENSYQEKSVGNSDWYIYWRGQFTLGLAGFPTYSERVVAGLEIVANTKPSTSGAIDTAVWWATGAEHNWSYETGKLINSGLCLGRDGRYPAIGNITIGTC